MAWALDLDLKATGLDRGWCGRRCGWTAKVQELGSGFVCRCSVEGNLGRMDWDAGAGDMRVRA